MADWLVGGGEMGKLIRATEWSITPFRSRERWPAAMRGMVNLVVSNRFPMALLWGHDLRLFYNDAYREIAGDQHPRALGRSFREVWPDLWSTRQTVLAAVMERGETISLEDQPFPIDRRGRREAAYFTVCYSPVRVEDGSVAGALVTLQETTRAKEALSNRERQFNVLTENLNAGVALLDETGRFTLYNARALEMFDLARDAGIHDLSSAEWANWEVRDEHGSRLPVDEHPVRKAARTLEPVRNRLVGVRPPKGGQILWMLVSATPLLRSDGTLEHLICTFHDTTELKHTEEVLRRREATLAQAGQMAHLGAWEIEVRDPGDVDAGPLTWSDEVYRIFGFAPGAVPVTNDLFFRCVHPEDRAHVVRAVATAIEARRPYSVEHRIVRPDGTERIVQEHAELVFNERGTLIHIVGAVQDITEHKLAEAALRDADRRKNDFLAILSHELRNPLAPIRNSIFILERAPPGGEQANRARRVIDRQVQHMTRLIEDLLDVTRISRGKVKLRRERLDLCALARRTVEDHRDLYARSRVELVVENTEEPVWVDGDPTRLAQVIGNLLSNSAKFTSPGGRTVLSVAASTDSRAVVRVRDNGAGMTPATIASLFQPFVQAAQTIERTRGGLGLGLALVKGLVEMHGGAITAESAGEGKGSTFTVALPLQLARPQLGLVAPSGRSSSGRRVLIIEDNVDAAETLREALELGKHEVIVAYSGPDGIAAAKRHKPDVVLCDIGLPGLDGYAVARALRVDPELKSTFLVALSGYALQEDVTKSKQAGFDHHVAKPPSVLSLEKLLAEAEHGRSRV